MRPFVSMLLAFFCSTLLAGAVDRVDLDRRIQKHASKFEALMLKNPIPADVLKKAKGIVLLDRTKAGVVFAFQGGSGVAMVRGKDGQWGPVAFLKATEASLGVQIGGQQSFHVMLLMNEDATHMLTNPTFEFGGEARGTAGDSSAGAEDTVKSAEQAVMIYDQRSGLFGGAAVKGGALEPDTEANQVYYSDFLTVKEILFDKRPEPSKMATKLSALIEEYAGKSTK